MSEPWYTVKCLFHHPDLNHPGDDFLYEERLTLWKAESFEEAHRMAEEEARRYASENNCVFVKSTDSFHLFEEEIVAGGEIYSTMRGSNLQPDAYFRTFCVTNRDRLLPLRPPQKDLKAGQPDGTDNSGASPLRV